MQGVNILNTTEIIKLSTSIFFYVGVISGIIGIALSLYVLITNTYNSKTLDRLIFFCIILVIITSLINPNKKEQSGRYQYEATIDDTVSFTELNDKYEVIGQRGKIWILEDKEESR